MIRAGIVGFSEGNGHPFSFSAIVNGYDREHFKNANWPVILDYLDAKPRDAFGIDGVRFTHVWTQDPSLSLRLSNACNVETVCHDVEDMIGKVDAVVIARDDWESHIALALPFLEFGTPVFVDKPLTLSDSELATFTPYLESGKLMSCSGFRFASELEAFKLVGGHSCVKLVSGAVLNDFCRYGIHMLEAVAGLGPEFCRYESITRLNTSHQSFLLRFKNGGSFHLDCLGAVVKTFRLSFFTESEHVHFDLHDNFGAFRQTLKKFFAMVEFGKIPIEPESTVKIIELLIAGNRLGCGEAHTCP